MQTSLITQDALILRIILLLVLILGSKAAKAGMFHHESELKQRWNPENSVVSTGQLYDEVFAVKLAHN